MDNVGDRGARLDVTRHDVVHDEIPTGAYDLVHARLLLVHLPERERVLDSLVRSLRPGGWVVIEDFDNMFLDVGSAATPEQAVVRKVALAFKRLLQDRGADLAYARRLPDLLRAPADFRVSPARVGWCSAPVGRRRRDWRRQTTPRLPRR